jgi:hypothetical protein
MPSVDSGWNPVGVALDAAPLATYWRFVDDISESESGPLSGEYQLAAAVIRKAKTDLRSSNAQYRAEARAFFSGYRGSLELWCSLVGLEPEVIQHLLEKQLPK